jgi:hypothetical protein
MFKGLYKHKETTESIAVAYKNAQSFASALKVSFMSELQLLADWCWKIDKARAS